MGAFRMFKTMAEICITHSTYPSEVSNEYRRVLQYLRRKIQNQGKIAESACSRHEPEKTSENRIINKKESQLKQQGNASLRRAAQCKTIGQADRLWLLSIIYRMLHDY